MSKRAGSCLMNCSNFLTSNFFDRDAQQVAKELLGKVIRVKYYNHWLSAMIIETEAYYRHEKGSHASLGFTEKRKALFMPAGTIYMYYARGGDSLNVSCQGEGNAVLIKSARPYVDEISPEETVTIMQQLNPIKTSGKLRPKEKLCSGQTLVCRSLNLKVPHWNQKQFTKEHLYIETVGYCPYEIIQAKRLGIPEGRDEHLLYRFIDRKYASICTSNPLSKKKFIFNEDYLILKKEISHRQAK